VAELPHRFEAKEDKTTAVVLVGNLGEAIQEEVDAGSIQTGQVARGELCLVLELQQPVRRRFL
jgi:hypothetical protein